MPRNLPRYDQELAGSISLAKSFTEHIEQMRIGAVTGPRAIVKMSDVEFSYELAFLRIFLAWEVLLENVLLRLMCGYQHSGGQEALRSGRRYYKTIMDAETAVLGGRLYKLWHNPRHVIERAEAFLNRSRFEAVLKSAESSLTHYASVRHRIAHSQKHAQREFDRATMSLAGKRYQGSRPGRFLRDWVATSNPPKRWISATSDELQGLAQQLCN
jgi:hypothetical protein